MASAEEPDRRSMRERMLAGDLYIADAELAAAHDAAIAVVERYNAPAVPATERRVLLEKLLSTVGANTEIRPPFYVDYGFNIAIGAGCFANFGLMALDVAPITIGDDVQFGPNVQLLTPTHPVDPALRRAKWESGKPITIGDNVWIGGGAIVLAGATIGNDTIVGAGAVVTRDLPAGVVAVGNPARVVRSLTERSADGTAH